MAKTTWKKFAEIENSYNAKTREIIAECGFMNLPSVATLKVDGANISFFYTRDGDYRIAKRTTLIADDDNFYNMPEFKKMYANNVKQLATEVLNKFEDAVSVTIYGEVYGGYYRNKEVEANSKAKAVQKRVSYTPNNQIIVFAIAYNTVYDDSVNSIYLDWEYVRELCSKYEFPLVPVIAKGTFEELLSFDIESLQDTLYRRFELPPVDDNPAEGIVIIPLKERRLPNGSRMILKLKNSRFAEKKKDPSAIKIKAEMSDEAKKMLKSLFSYITPSRYFSIVSKIGDVDTKDFGMIMREYYNDVIREATVDWIDIDTIENKNDQKMIQKELTAKISEIVKDALIYGKSMKEMNEKYAK